MVDIVKVQTSQTRIPVFVTRDDDYIGNYSVKYDGISTVSNTTGSNGNVSYSNSRETHQPEKWDWTKRIRNKENATTYLKGYRYVPLVVPSGSIRATWVGYDPYLGYYRPMSTTLTGVVPGYRAAPLLPSGYTPSSNAALGAKMKLLKELRQIRTAFEGSTFLGELTETLRMIRRPGAALRRGLSDYLDTLKKRVSRSDKKINTVKRVVSGTWLEYAFGWTPFVNDIAEAQEALASQFDKFENATKGFSVQFDDSLTATEWSTYVLSTSTRPFTVLCRYRRRTASSLRYYGSVWVHAYNSRFGLTKHYGLTPSDWLPALWEVLPWSFVADYFTNLGDMISAASTFTGDVRWISSTVVNEGIVEHEVTSYSINEAIVASYTMKGLIIVAEVADQLAIAARRVERQATSVPTLNPFADFRWRLPGLTSTKWINLSALLAQTRSTESFIRAVTRKS